MKLNKEEKIALAKKIRDAEHKRSEQKRDNHEKSLYNDNVIKAIVERDLTHLANLSIRSKSIFDIRQVTVEKLLQEHIEIEMESYTVPVLKSIGQLVNEITLAARDAKTFSEIEANISALQL